MGYAKARHYASGLTIDDLRDALPPLPEGVDRRAYGAIFKGGEFKCLGYQRSSRRECNGRPIGVFVLRHR